MSLWAYLVLGVAAGAAVFWLLLWRGTSRQRAAAIAMVAGTLLLPVISLLLLETTECDDVACGFLLFAWLWRSVLLIMGAAIGIFVSMLSPWGAE